jgi:hypothetical protein
LCLAYLLFDVDLRVLTVQVRLEIAQLPQNLSVLLTVDLLAEIVLRLCLHLRFSEFRKAVRLRFRRFGHYNLLRNDLLNRLRKLNYLLGRFDVVNILVLANFVSI